MLPSEQKTREHSAREVGAGARIEKHVRKETLVADFLRIEPRYEKEIYYSSSIFYRG